MTQHNIEPELLTGTPRQISLRNKTSGSTGCLAIFLIPFVAIGAFTFVLAFCLSLVLFFGTNTTGTITYKKDISGSRGHNYRINFRFDADGKSHTGSDTLKRDDFELINIGSKVPVRYPAAAPSMLPTVVTSLDRRLDSVAFIWAHTILWNLLIWFIIYQTFWVPRICRTLYINGVAGIAEITGKRRNTRRIITYTIEYAFTPLENKEKIVPGKMTVSPGDANNIDLGERYTVLYLPYKPYRNLLYRFGPYQSP